MGVMGGFALEYKGQIHRGMTGHGESELGLVGIHVLHPGDKQCARIQDGGQCGQPGLIVVLGAVKAEYRVGEMTLQDFRRPPFPLGEERRDGLEVMGMRQPGQELGRAGRRAAPGVQERDGHLAPRKSLVENGQITNHARQKSKTKSCFHHAEKTPDGSGGRDVSVTKGEKGGPAEIQIRGEAGVWAPCPPAENQPKRATGRSRSPAPPPKLRRDPGGTKAQNN